VLRFNYEIPNLFNLHKPKPMGRGGGTTFFSILYYVIGDKGYIQMIKSHGTPKWES